MQRNAAAKPAASPFEFSGGALCLDFANTVNHRPAAHRQELLTDFAVLVAWSREARLLSEAQARDVLRRMSHAHAKAQAALHRAQSLREVIYSVCSAAAAKRPPDVQQLAALNRLLAEILAHSSLEPRGSGFAWAHPDEGQPIDGVLWAVARSAADLLTSDALAQVRECAATNCGWLFLDRSKNGSRRWCDMKVCGNRAKVQRFRRRARKTH